MICGTVAIVKNARARNSVYGDVEIREVVDNIADEGKGGEAFKRARVAIDARGKR
jgi:hypothetical protein